MKKYILYTDGGARGNPGNAGVGIVITDEVGQMIHEASKALGEATNNEAEYHGVIFGLEQIKEVVGMEELKLAQVELRMDSQLVARQITKKYKIKEPRMKDLWLMVQDLLGKYIPNFSVVEIPREENTEADRLANEAMDTNS